MDRGERVTKIRGHLNMAYCLCGGDLSLLTDALASGMAERGRSSEYVRRGIFTAIVIAIKKTVGLSGNRRQQMDMLWTEKK